MYFQLSGFVLKIDHALVARSNSVVLSLLSCVKQIKNLYVVCFFLHYSFPCVQICG